MSTLKALRTRIRSVQATQKITTAMKLVSAAKLKKAQDQLQGFQGYASAIRSIWAKASEDVDTNDLPLWMQPHGDNHLYIVLMSDRGLCGSYNAAMVRHMKRVMEERSRYNAHTKILPIGYKAIDLLKRDMGSHFGDILFPNREHKPHTEEIVETLTQYLSTYLTRERYGAVRIYYTRFINVLRQDIESVDLVKAKNSEEVKESSGYPPLFEPDQASLISSLAPLYFKNLIRYAVYESATSEQASRMRAMDTATENAGDVITKLKRTYNRTRQAGITRELIEIISGANALEG